MGRIQICAARISRQPSRHHRYPAPSRRPRCRCRLIAREGTGASPGLAQMRRSLDFSTWGRAYGKRCVTRNDAPSRMNQYCPRVFCSTQSNRHGERSTPHEEVEPCIFIGNHDACLCIKQDGFVFSPRQAFAIGFWAGRVHQGTRWCCHSHLCD